MKAQALEILDTVNALYKTGAIDREKMKSLVDSTRFAMRNDWMYQAIAEELMKISIESQDDFIRGICDECIGKISRRMYV